MKTLDEFIFERLKLNKNTKLKNDIGESWNDIRNAFEHETLNISSLKKISKEDLNYAINHNTGHKLRSLIDNNYRVDDVNDTIYIITSIKGMYPYDLFICNIWKDHLKQYGEELGYGITLGWGSKDGNIYTEDAFRIHPNHLYEKVTLMDFLENLVEMNTVQDLKDYLKNNNIPYEII